MNVVIEGGHPAKAAVTGEREVDGEQRVDLWVFPTEQTGGAGRVLSDVPLLDKPGENGEPPAALGERVNYAYPWAASSSAGSTSASATGSKTLKR